MDNNTELTDITGQPFDDGLLPEDAVQLEDIAADANMKADTDYIKQNAVRMVRGDRPEFLYNPLTDKYDWIKGGIEGTEERGMATELSDLEKLAMEEFIRDYKQRHDGRFVTYDELVYVSTASKLKSEYNRVLYTFIDAFNECPFTRKDAKKKTPGSLSAEAGWMLIAATEDVRILHRKEGSGEVLGFYHHLGKHAGTWTLEERRKSDNGALSDARSIVKVCSQFGIKEKGAAALIYANLQTLGAGLDGTVTEDIQFGVNENLIPCANGVVDISNVKTTFTNEEKTEWTADGFDFEPYLNDDGTENQNYTRKYKKLGIVYKLATDWNPDAKNVTFTADDGYEWSVDKGLDDITEDGEGKASTTRALWEMANSCIRGTGFGHNPICTDGTRLGNGGGGKSTWLKIIAAVIDLITNTLAIFRNIDILCDDEFGLQGLENMILAIFGNESGSNDKKGDNGGIKNATRWKAIMRHETLSINRKCLPIVDTRIMAAFIGAVNGGMKIQSNDAAVWRTMFALMFPKRLTAETDANGNPIDRTYICNDYAKRKEVREYVLYKALSLGAITDYNPEAIVRGEKNLALVRTERNTVYEYMTEWGSTVLGDRHILDFVFDHYRLWCSQTNHRGGVSRDEFTRRVGEWIDTCHPGWKLIEDNTKGVKFKKNLAGDRYLAELKLNPNRGKRDINQYIKCVNEDGEAIFRQEWANGKKFTGAYLDRAGAEVQELTATTPEEETQYYGEYIAWWYLKNAYDIFYNNVHPNNKPSKEDWIKAGKPRIHYRDTNTAGGMLLDIEVPTTSRQEEEKEEETA